jgi:hypothetical protein
MMLRYQFLKQSYLETLLSQTVVCHSYRTTAGLHLVTRAGFNTVTAVKFELREPPFESLLPSSSPTESLVVMCRAGLEALDGPCRAHSSPA